MPGKGKTAAGFDVSEFQPRDVGIRFNHSLLQLKWWLQAIRSFVQERPTSMKDCHAPLIHLRFRRAPRPVVVMTSIQKAGINAWARSCFAILFVTFVIQSAIPVSTALASTPEFHTVTFVENDSPSDPVYSTQTASAQSSLTEFANLSPTFTDSGFSFVDWNSSPDGSGVSYANGSTYSFAAAEILYATWTPIYHTVTFVENDNSSDLVSSSQTENVQTALTSFVNLSPSFSDSGSTFVDWNSESDGAGVSYADGSSYAFTEPIVLYAIWTPIPTATLSFESVGGTGTVGPILSHSGESTTLPSGSGISNPGYTFVGWNTAADGSGTEYQAGDTYVFTGNQTLYAQWSPDTYTVTYTYDGGVATPNSANYVVGTAALVLPTPTFAGSTFDGWFTAETGGNLIGVGGATLVPTESIQVFAQWTSIAIDTLTFDANGGTGSIASYSGENGASATLPTIDGITNVGFAFSGWNTQADGSGTQYAEGVALTLVGDQTFYAQWTAGPSDTVTFDANGGSGSIAPINGSPGSTITLPDQTGLIHAGFELIRWNTSATGAGTSYPVGQGFKLAGSIVLYAQWSGHKLATLFGAIGMFKTGSPSLSAALKSQINRVALTIKSRKYVTVELFGYTAATGLRSLNVSLSRARARNVAVYLRNRLADLKVRGVKISSTGEGAIAGQSSNSYSRVEVFGV